MIQDSRYIIINKPKDRMPRYQVIEQDIRLLTAEIYRLSKLPYSSRKNQEQMISMDKRIMELENILAAYQRDQKQFE